MYHKICTHIGKSFENILLQNSKLLSLFIKCFFFFNINAIKCHLRLRFRKVFKILNFYRQLKEKENNFCRFYIRIKTVYFLFFYVS